MDKPKIPPQKVLSIGLVPIAGFVLFSITILFCLPPENNFQSNLFKLQNYLRGNNKNVMYLDTNGNRFEPGKTIDLIKTLYLNPDFLSQIQAKLHLAILIQIYRESTLYKVLANT